MARALLVQPPQLSKMTKDIDMRHLSPHIGLAYVAAYLRANGVDASVLDAKAERMNLSDISNVIRDKRPDILGITAMTCQIIEAARVAAIAKSINPKIVTEIGGCHATAIPEETLKQFKPFDFAVFGEGEITSFELCRSIASQYTSPPLEEIAGLAYREDAGIKRNSDRPYISDLDLLPLPAFDLFPLKKYWPYYSKRWFMELPICSSRGCPHRCTFCSRPLGDQVRYRSVASMVEEVKRDVFDYEVRQILFTVESFTENEKQAEEFCREIVKSGLNKKVSFICPSRTTVSYELLKLMSEANFTYITFGIESGSQRVLDLANKGAKLEDAKKVVTWAKSLGITADGSFILGLPYDDEDSIRDTIRFANNLPLDTASFSILVPFPQSEVMRMAKRGEGGLKLLSEDWSLYGKQVGGALELKKISRQKLEKLHLLAYFRFFMRPRRFFNVFKVTSFRIVILLFGKLMKRIIFGRRDKAVDSPSCAARCD